MRVGTVLLSSRAPIGYLAIAEVPTAVNQGFIAMICRKRLPALYVLSWCYENLERIRDISGGSTFAEISKKAFRPLPVVVPANRILGVYNRASRSLYDRIVSNTSPRCWSLCETFCYPSSSPERFECMIWMSSQDRVKTPRRPATFGSHQS